MLLVSIRFLELLSVLSHLTLLRSISPVALLGVVVSKRL
jgi:hypothetical protein